MAYVKLMSQHKMTSGIKRQLECFLEGFEELLPRKLLQIFNEQEVELLICGVPEIDRQDLKNNTEYQGGFTRESQEIKWFWQLVEEMSKEDVAALLMFTTGTSAVPLGGFAELVGMHGTQRFTIQRGPASNTELPSSHTCFNSITLPVYPSFEVLREKVLVAIREGGEGFGFA